MLSQEPAGIDTDRGRLVERERVPIHQIAGSVSRKIEFRVVLSQRHVEIGKVVRTHGKPSGEGGVPIVIVECVGAV